MRRIVANLYRSVTKFLEALGISGENFDVDQSQIDRNLNLTPEQRLIEHQAALDLCHELSRAGQKLHEQSQ